MLETITLGDIGVMVAFVVALISGVSIIAGHLKKWIKASLADEFNPIKTQLNEIKKEIGEVDMESCKNYLVRFLSDVEQGNLIDEIEKERFWEQYEHYSKHGGNGYVHRKVDKLKEKGLL